MLIYPFISVTSAQWKTLPPISQRQAAQIPQMDAFPGEADDDTPHVEYSFMDPKFSSSWNPRRALAYTSVVLPLGDPKSPRNANGRGGMGGAAAHSMLPPPPPQPAPIPSPRHGNGGGGPQDPNEELEVEPPPMIDRSLIRAPIRVQDPIGGTKDTVYGSTFRNFAMQRRNPYASKMVYFKPKPNGLLEDPKCEFCTLHLFSSTSLINIEKYFFSKNRNVLHSTYPYRSQSPVAAVYAAVPVRQAGQRAGNVQNGSPGGPQAPIQQQQQQQQAVSDEDLRRVYGWTVDQVHANGGFPQPRVDALRSALQAADRANRGALPFLQVCASHNHTHTYIRAYFTYYKLSRV